jgi:hypothetical protein
MKKSNIILITIFLLSISAFSQDIIYKTNGYAAKISEVNIETIKVDRQDNPITPAYMIQKSEASEIKYNNGVVDIIPEGKCNDELLNQPNADISGTGDENEYGHNIIAFDPIGLAFKNATFSYEFFTYSQKMGYKIPLTFGMDNKGYFSSGLYFKYYPATSAGVVKYFIGPYLQVAGDKDYYYFAVQLDNGISFQPFKALNISLDFSIGPGVKAEPRYVPDIFKGAPKQYYPAWLIGLTLGWRF